ncbi:MAG: pyridoxamine 5'-phosphate oxidase family protein [bacterium]
MQPPSTRATIKRNAKRAQYDTEVLKNILDSQQICQVAFVENGEPRLIPTLYFCDENYLYLHGNRQSALLKHMAAGGEVCINVMLVDGFVVARSGFNCSMNYRSVTVFGKGEAVNGTLHREALDRFVAVLLPGHEKAVRAPTAQELAATAVVRVSLAEMAGKIRDGDPVDDATDKDSAVWAGIIPLRLQAGAAIPSADLKAGIELPEYLQQFKV